MSTGWVYSPGHTATLPLGQGSHSDHCQSQPLSGDLLPLHPPSFRTPTPRCHHPCPCQPYTTLSLSLSLSHTHTVCEHTSCGMAWVYLHPINNPLVHAQNDPIWTFPPITLLLQKSDQWELSIFSWTTGYIDFLRFWQRQRGRTQPTFLHVS